MFYKWDYQHNSFPTKKVSNDFNDVFESMFGFSTKQNHTTQTKDNKTTVKVPVPGYNKETLKVFYSSETGNLVVKSSKNDSFQEAIHVGYNYSKVSAECIDGLLTVSLIKESKEEEVEIK